MTKYLLRRLLYSIPTVISITIIIFLAMRVIPGDPLTSFYGPGEVSALTEKQRANIINELGLDDPLYVQYFRWIGGVLSGDLGKSFFRTMTVGEMLAHRAPTSIEIAILATILSWIIAIPVGLTSALYKNSIMDHLSRFATIFFLAVPNFWLGMLVVVFSVLVFRYHPPSWTIQLWEDPLQNLSIIWRPSIIIALGAAAPLARMLRATVLEVMSEDYIRTARAKGLDQATVVSRHAIRNAMIPTITYSGVIFGFLLGGSIAVESAMGIRGLGSLLVSAIAERDTLMAQNLILIYGIIWTFINLFIDVTYAIFDPRIRFE